MSCKFLKFPLVLLAPYGLNAHLTGYSIPDNDTRSSKIFEEWKKFFQINDFPSKTGNGELNTKNDGLPRFVEVTLGEVKMLYPSSLVLIPITTTKSKEKLQKNIILFY